MHYSAAQYRNRDRWNAQRRAALPPVPRPLDPDEPIEWTPVWSLTERRYKLLPTDLLYYHEPSTPSAERIAVACSNGCAAGNTIEEAVLQGSLELVERDAVAIWWYNRLRRPAIDLTSFGDRWLSELPRHYRSLGREVVVLDLTSDLGIPVAAAVSHRVADAEERICLGVGCHLELRIAVQRALTEAVQMLNTDLSGNRRQIREFGDGWLTSATRADHPYLAPDAAVPPRTGADVPEPRFSDLVQCIDACRDTLESRGMELLVLDQTRADTRMPAVKVIVPGLRHFWPRFAPGRLYDVPVSMGCRRCPTAEADLNSIPFLF